MYKAVLPLQGCPTETGYRTLREADMPLEAYRPFQYLLVTVPIEMICFVPPALCLLGVKGPVEFFPTVACLKMLLGTETVWYELLPVSVFTLLLLAGFAWLRMNKMWSCLGGAKL